MKPERQNKSAYLWDGLGPYPSSHKKVVKKITKKKLRRIDKDEVKKQTSRE